MHKSLGLVSGPEQTQCGGAHLQTQSLRGRSRGIRSSKLQTQSFSATLRDYAMLNVYLLSVAEIRMVTKRNLGRKGYVWFRHPSLGTQVITRTTGITGHH